KMGINPPTGFQGWWTVPSYFTAAQARVKTYLCPSDNPELSGTGTFLIFYCDANALTFTGGYYPNPTGNLFGRSNYQPSGRPPRPPPARRRVGDASDATGRAHRGPSLQRRLRGRGVGRCPRRPARFRGVVEGGRLLRPRLGPGRPPAVLPIERAHV